MKKLKYILRLALVLAFAFGVMARPASTVSASDCPDYCVVDLVTGTLVINGDMGDSIYPISNHTTCPWYQYRNQIKTIVIYESCKNIAQGAFYNFTNVTTVYIADGVETIERDAFRNCTSLSTIEIPNSVTSIGYKAFGGCTSLESVSLGNGMKSLVDVEGYKMDTSPFYGCTALSSISVPANCHALLANTALFGSNQKNAAVLPQLIYRGSRASLKADFVNTYNASIQLATEIICSDGTWDEDVPVLSETSTSNGVTTGYEVYHNRTIKYYFSTFSLTDKTFLSSFLPFTETLILSYNVNKFNDDQIGQLTNLKTIIFEGTQEEWNAISKGSGNDIPKGVSLTVHSHKDYGYSEKDYKPSCTSKGYTIKVCEGCGREYGSKYNLLPMLAHDKQIVTGTDATCVSTGSAMYRCSSCGQEWREVLPVDPDKHVNTISYYTMASCMEAGGEYTVCQDCGATMFKETAAKLDHNLCQDGTYADGSIRYYCSKCFNNIYFIDTKAETPVITTSKKSPVFYYQNDGQGGILEYSTDGGQNWLTWGEVTGSDKLSLTYTPGTTYSFRREYYQVWYSSSGFQSRDYSQYSDVYTITIPKTLPYITGITNGNDYQQITWKKGSALQNATNVSYYLIEDQSKNSWTCSSALADTSVVWGLHQVNGKSHSYKIGCQYTDAEGTTRYLLTGKAYSYYYLTRPALTYYKNIAAGKIKLTWKRNSSATGYQVKYTCGSISKTYTISGNKNVTRTLGSLKKGKTYKCYVRSYKTVSGRKYYSAWSKYKCVKVAR